MEYGLFAGILVALMFLLPPALTPMLGPTLGQYTSYAITGGVGMVSLWASKKVGKAMKK
jgi:hypothetical protein